MSSVERLYYIDFLRFVGISAIILAHVNVPDNLMQFRCFDVPLMLFVSGLSYANKDFTSIKCGNWMLSRLKRLLIPVYLFLVFYFIVYHLLLHYNIINEPYLRVEIIGSFFLLNGRSIGYVWIYKVFILVMLLTPFLIRVQKKLSNMVFLIVSFGLLLLNDFILNIVFPIIEDYKAVHYISKQIVPYAIAYSVPFLFGLRLRNCSQNQVVWFVTLLLATLFLSSVYYYAKGYGLCHFHPFFKYPPHLYFIIYGLFISSTLWMLKKQLNILAKLSMIRFIGSNTTWIYLFHILPVTITRLYVDQWYVRFIIVYSLSISIYALWYYSIKYITTKKEMSILKYLIG